MTLHEGHGPGGAALREDLQVVLILGTAEAAAATARGLGYHAGWVVPQATTGAACARRHTAPEECRTPVRRGNRDEENRVCGKLGEVPVMPGADWRMEIEGRSVLPVRMSSWTESIEDVVAQHDGSKTPSPGGGVQVQ